jgi:hypothetical protein
VPCAHRARDVLLELVGERGEVWLPSMGFLLTKAIP